MNDIIVTKGNYYLCKDTVTICTYADNDLYIFEATENDKVFIYNRKEVLANVKVY